MAPSELEQRLTKALNPRPRIVLTSNHAGWRHANFAEIAFPQTGAYDADPTSNTVLALPLSGIKFRPAGKRNFQELPTRPILQPQEVRGVWQGATNCLVLHISEQFIQRALYQYACVNNPRAFQANSEKIAHLMHLVREDLRMGCPVGVMISEFLATEIIKLIHPDDQASCSVESRSSRREVKRVCEYIDANLQQPLRLIELAGCVGLSTRHLNRTFKSAMGFTPYDYVLRRRVEKARQLLTTTRLSLVDIAMSLGFSSHSHMTSAFRKITGNSPSDFRSK